MKPSASILSQIKAARRVSVPLVAIATPDPAATIKAIVEMVNGAPMVQWDGAEGMRSLNETGKDALAVATGEGESAVANPMAALSIAKKLPGAKKEPKLGGTVVFFHLANRWVADPLTIQAVWNLRDEFKRDGRMLVLLSITADWPPELSGDIVAFDEPLPDGEALAALVQKLHKDAGLEIQPEILNKSVEAVQGLPAFQAEQVVAMSLSKQGLDVPALWERKRKQIELTAGLKVHRDPTRYADVGGVAVVKSFLKRIMDGNARPNAVVFIDEIEKFLAGASGSVGDSSGVSQDQLGQLLSYMQDQNAAGCIFVGPPGAAKSAVAKATGNEAGIPTIQLDLGAMKGSLVGSSEHNLRNALKVVTSVSNGRSLWIATCNSIADLPPELRRRFTLGTFFFDLPDEIERKAIWKIWLSRFEITKSERPDDVGWTGAEIRQCCDIAWRLSCSLKEAANFVVPVSRSAAEQLEKLRKAAEGRFLSASKSGVYRRTESAAAHEPTGLRRLELEE
jgi:hypothetical protein